MVTEEQLIIWLTRFDCFSSLPPTVPNARPGVAAPEGVGGRKLDEGRGRKGRGRREQEKMVGVGGD